MLRPSTASLISANAAGSRANSVRPASVRETLRVVRLNSLVPTRSSSARIVWLKAERERPSLGAARTKLCVSATATKAVSSAKSLPFTIVVSCSTRHANYSSFSNISATITLQPISTKELDNQYVGEAARRGDPTERPGTVRGPGGPSYRCWERDWHRARRAFCARAYRATGRYCWRGHLAERSPEASFSTGQSILVDGGFNIGGMR